MNFINNVNNNRTL